MWVFIRQRGSDEETVWSGSSVRLHYGNKGSTVFGQDISASGLTVSRLNGTALEVEVFFKLPLPAT